MTTSEADRRDNAQRLRQRLGELLADHRRPEAVTEALRVVRAHEIDIPMLYEDVLTPLMHDVGVGWQRGLMRVWEEHLASSAVRTIVDALYPRVLELKLAAAPVGKKVLLACPPREAHDLGLRMLSDLFDMAGWETYLLGPDVPTEEIADAAVELEVDLVVLTSATHFHRIRIRDVIDRLYARSPAVRVVVAGAAFAQDTEGLSAEEIFSGAEFFGGGTGVKAAATDSTAQGAASDAPSDAGAGDQPPKKPRKRAKKKEA